MLLTGEQKSNHTTEDPEGVQRTFLHKAIGFPWCPDATHSQKTRGLWACAPT